MALVYICPDSTSRTGAEFLFPADGNGAANYPWCGEGPEGFGQWVDVSTLVTSTPTEPMPPPETLGQAFGAGFIVMGTGLLLAMGVRIVVGMVRKPY